MFHHLKYWMYITSHQKEDEWFAPFKTNLTNPTTYLGLGKHLRNVFKGHQQEVYSLNISLNGRLTVSDSGEKIVRIWDMYNGTSKVLTINDEDPCNGVASVVISCNGQFVAAGTLDSDGMLLLPTYLRG